MIKYNLEVMLLKIISLFILTLGLFFLPSSVKAAEEDLQEVDSRRLILKYYLASFNSPLQNYASDLIEVSDKYQIDWKLLPAIAGVESKFGLRIPGGTNKKFTSFNAWGWGVYGTKAVYFNSWDQGIETVAKGVRQKFMDKGLTTLKTLNTKYSSNPLWGEMVGFYLTDIEEYSEAFLSKFGAQIDGHNQKVKASKYHQQIFFAPVDLVVNGHGFGLESNY